MLLIVILFLALVRGLLVYAFGALLAALMWGVCLLLKWPAPSFVRWTLAAVIVGWNLFLNRIPPPAVYRTFGDFYYAVGMPISKETGWEILDFWANMVVIGIVLLALPGTGLIISSIKALVRKKKMAAQVQPQPAA